MNIKKRVQKLKRDLLIPEQVNNKHNWGIHVTEKFHKQIKNSKT